MKQFCRLFLLWGFIITKIHAFGEEVQPSSNEAISIKFVYEKPASPDAKGPAPFLDWFRVKNSTILLYKNAEAYYGFSPPSLITNLPEWLKGRSEGGSEQCSSEDGMKYSYKGASDGNLLQMKVAEFNPKSGWERDTYTLEGLNKGVVCSFSRDGRYMAFWGRQSGNGIELVELSATCKNNCPLGKTLWKDPFLGFRLQPSGERMMLFSAEGAYLLLSKTAKLERTFSFSAQIQRELSSLTKLIQGKSYNLSRRAEIDPEGHYVVLIEHCIENKCPSELTQVQIRDFKTGMLLYSFKGISGRVERAKFSWDGKYVAFSTNKGQIMAVEILSEKKAKPPSTSTKN